VTTRLQEGVFFPTYKSSHTIQSLQSTTRRTMSIYPSSSTTALVRIVLGTALLACASCWATTTTIAEEATNSTVSGNVRTRLGLLQRDGESAPSRKLQQVHTVPFAIGAATQYSDFYDTTEQHYGNCGSGPVDSKNVNDGVCVERGGTCSVGWTIRDEWLLYDFTMSASGPIDITLRLSSKRSTKKIAIDVDDTELSIWNAPGLGWSVFEDRVVENISLAEGAHQL